MTDNLVMEPSSSGESRRMPKNTHCSAARLVGSGFRRARSGCGAACARSDGPLPVVAAVVGADSIDL